MVQERLSRRGLGALMAGLAVPGLARGQSPASWPDRPVRLVVPFGAGGAIDTLSRTVAQRFSEFAGGQTLVVENRSGAGGTVGGAYVAREKPDGYTLMMADVGSNAIGKLLNPGLSYDPVTSFTPIVHLVNLPGVVIAHPSVTVKDLPDLIAQAKAKPGSFTYSSAGTGNGSHLFMALLLRQAGLDMVHVPYRSGAEMVTALVRGDAQFGFPTVSSALQMIRGGQAKAIAVSTAAETPALPGIPPVATVLPDFDLAVWHGIMAPAGMDPALAARINAVFNQVAALPEVKEAVFRAQAGRMVGGSPKDFSDHVGREVVRWKPLIEEGGFRVE
ncbi:Bug family tripartite tricarboxylate transporter substrate binding protein [Roseomonas xinghualingensis]|uniref:Bug family tripartite tricarboxylate transporter substrate binding protein n=1 Tax=Roseomonas xinghualingensis TaxID=2986475 RepID=UPI0021F0FF6E|nr:tripartite tricarboxylate transporter substrate-binding protein [Roseomonas sp. SXEYE001]MCV4207288.1 tripartite tricarboxylate transporter substrate-binding protein [Roseomonas sp. SXEYE001]